MLGDSALRLLGAGVVSQAGAVLLDALGSYGMHVAGNDVVTHPDIGKALCDGLRDGTLHLDENGDHFGHYYDQSIADLLRGHLLPRLQQAA